jgi:hypothetical protein
LRNSLRGKTRIALRVGRLLGRYKMREHFKLAIEETGFSFTLDGKALRAKRRSMASMSSAPACRLPR